MREKNIYLRPIEKKDLSLLNKWKNNESIFKYLGGGYQPISIDQQSQWLDSMIDLTGSNRRFMICEAKDVPIGMIGVYGINWIHRTCEVGIYIGETTAQGEGYGSEAYKILETYIKNYLNLRKIKVYVVKNNERAVSYWISLGFEQAGLLSDERYIDGKYYDLLIMDKFV